MRQELIVTVQKKLSPNELFVLAIQKIEREKHLKVREERKNSLRGK